MLTIQDWLDAGYRKYPSSAYRDAEFLLQKCIDDEVGKKYFVNVCVYNWKEFQERNPALPDYSFAPDVQFSFEDERPTINMQIIFTLEHTIQNVEDEFEKMWKFLDKPYYEKYRE